MILQSNSSIMHFSAIMNFYLVFYANCNYLIVAEYLHNVAYFAFIKRYEFNKSPF